MNFNYDELLKDSDELLQYSDNFSFDEIYPTEIDTNNYFEEPENAHIKQVSIKIEDQFKEESPINTIKNQQT